jgi:hypothetical protein
MSNLHTAAIPDPFRSPEIARIAVTTLGRAEAMGVLPRGEVIDHLDFSLLQRVVKGIAQLGIGRGASADLTTARSHNPQQLSTLLQQINEALVASPVPQYEWPSLVNILGTELLGRLVGISPSSVRRYLSGSRPTPDDVAARLHFLALIVGDLTGAYNDIGIRRWFDRKRTVLGNRTPADMFHGSWDPDDAGPQHVCQLAHVLVSSPVT